MKKVSTVIIDDETPAIENITLLLAMYCPEVTVVGTASTIAEGIQKIKQEQPDLVFLDISMPPEGTGFDLLALFPQRNFHVIFITAHEEFSLKALKEHAFDYILKPVDYKDLVSAIEDFITLNTEKKNNTSTFNTRITIKTEGEIHIILQNTILYCKAEGSYTTFYLENEKPIVFSKPLKYAEKLLDKTLFYRCHRSYVINFSKINKIIKREGGYLQILENQIPIGRNYYNKIMSLF